MEIYAPKAVDRWGIGSTDLEAMVREKLALYPAGKERQPDLNLCERLFSKGSKSCTTILSLKFRDSSGIECALAITDGQSTAWGAVRGQIAVKKIHDLDSHSVMEGTGYSIGCEYFGKLLAAWFESHECLNDGKIMDVDAKAKMIASIVLDLIMAGDTPYFFIPILTAFDKNALPPRARIFDLWGQVEEQLGFCANGSGSALAEPYLRDHWREDLTREEALRLGVAACHVAACPNTPGTGLFVNEARNAEILGPDGIEVIPYVDLVRILEKDVQPACKGCCAERAKGG